MSYFKEFRLHTEKEGAYNITSQISDAISESSIENGIVLIFCPHTTAGLIITENTDHAVTSDLLFGMKSAFPDHKEYKHSEGNSFAHIKSSVTGCQLTIIIDGGWHTLGPWQGIFFMEFDGPRERRYQVKIIEC
ncbi:MAG: hypothetical protein BGN88_14620 [Clostridiales bacterium 43-6]|nr:MAG: hypothetical protein BGN88_14620 [Clostridiales bacterium 43-6]